MTVSKADLDFTTFYDPYAETDNVDLNTIQEYNMGNTKGYNISNCVDTEKSMEYTQKYSNEDVMLLAKLMTHEAKGEGINGWIGVGEVVVNRINSGLFPKTVEGVVYQDGQFSGSNEIESMQPSDDIVKVADMVLNGGLRIFNNNNVMYFKNPMITDGIPATTQQDWGSYKWFTAVNHHAFYLQH